jgi:hypothetical protein
MRRRMSAIGTSGHSSRDPECRFRGKADILIGSDNRVYRGNRSSNLGMQVDVVLPG